MQPHSQRYLIEKTIGEGGSAIVQRAHDTRIGRPVAIKRFKRTNMKDPESLRELEALSRVSHPNVVCCYDADLDESGSYLVMELIEGADVESLVDEIPFKIPAFLNFAYQCLEAVHATHASGVLHLDIKPANIMLSEMGGNRCTVKLIDFNNAKRAQNERGNQPRGQGMEGSIHYLAPEQLLSDPLDRRTDLYALGCVFYWCLTGRRPFTGENAMIVMASHMQHHVIHLSDLAPQIPRWLGNWVMSLIALNADDRPSSAKRALEMLTQGQEFKIGA